MRADQKLMNETLRRVFRRLHYPIEVILVCVRWYVAYPLSLRHLEEMMAERGVAVDHSTIHRWAVKMLPVLAAICRRRKRPVGKSWRMDETYIKVADRHLEEMMEERGVSVEDHSSINRWEIRFLPMIEKMARKHKREVGTSWRMDETYIKVRGIWKYLYRAVDKQGRTVV
jgi:transposase-like protein